MKKTLYLECLSGISGDMTVAALLDLGADRDVLAKSLNSLNTGGFRTEISTVEKNGIKALDFAVLLDSEHENRDHDMEYLHGRKEPSHHHGHCHTSLSDIIHIIENSDITENAKKIALRTFDILGESEAKAHGIAKENVTFHEVGAVDSIVDIVSAAVCFDNLGITDVIVPKLCEGTGFVRCRHGVLPVPVPAVLNIVSTHGINLKITDTEGEFVTPTGAAFVAAVMTSDKLPDGFSVKKVGIGAGKRSYEKPSLLRAMLIEPDEDVQVFKLETNIDDCSGEVLGYVMEKLFKGGARDVNYMPVFMKKNRPAYQLNVICSAKDVSDMEKIIFENTTTIGIRKYKTERSVLERKMIRADFCDTEVEVKVCTLPDGEKRYYPEYESVVKVCENHKIPYREAYSRIVSLCTEKR